MKIKTKYRRLAFFAGGIALVMSLVIIGRLLGVDTAIRQVNRLISVEPKQEVVNSTVPAATKQFDHSTLSALLGLYVNNSGWVDYAGLKRERDKLDSYLTTLASASPQTFANDPERLAFWINAYNAFTLSDVLDDVYGKAKSVQDVPAFFERKHHLVGSISLTLDGIEQRCRGFGDPRIHFALVCASTSCPKLQRSAYTGPDLEEQLDRAVREFLADPTRGLRLDREHNEIFLSSIFKWYAGDFTMASTKAKRAVALTKAYLSGTEGLSYVRKYAPADVSTYIDEKKPAVRYLNYDWTLNAQDLHSSAFKSDGVR
jgi:hypothetical protein